MAQPSRQELSSASEKIHRPLVQEVIKALEAIFFSGALADKYVNHTLKIHGKWGSRDRRFFAENVYDVVRRWRFLWSLLGLEATEKHLLNLWVVYRWIRTRKWLAEFPLVGLAKADIEARYEDLAALKFAVRESYPDWLDQLMRSELPENWENIGAQLNCPGAVDLRTNLSRISRSSLQKELAQEGVVTEPIGDSACLTLKERKNVFVTKAFLKGFFEVQDRASQLVAQAMAPQPGERIVDACAGSGGKSLHLADLMSNKGKIISLDINQNKLLALRERARRCNFSLIETRLIESSKVIKRLAESADKLLLDVPCSGLGVIRRHPDTKWKLSPGKIIEVKEIQKKILADYVKMVKPGGKLVYSTCSILPSENQDQMAWFVASHPEFSILKQQTIYPSAISGDGFFICELRRSR